MTPIWTQPKAWSTSELLTASLLNTHLRDNLDWLKTPPQASADISATVGLTTTTFADFLTLASITSAGGPLLVGFHGMAAFSAAPATLTLDVTMDGASLAGAGSTFRVDSPGVSLMTNVSFVLYVPAPLAGPHVLKLRGKISAGTANVFGSTAGYLGRFFVREI